jgi:hypothetical protein
VTERAGDQLSRRPLGWLRIDTHILIISEPLRPVKSERG